MPSTPFIGVRISWLMLARNSLFAAFAIAVWAAISFAQTVVRSRTALTASSSAAACSARSLARRSSSSRRWWPDVSRTTATVCHLPYTFTGVVVISTGNSAPSLHRTAVSRIWRVFAPASGTGTSDSTGRPSISLRE